MRDYIVEACVEGVDQAIRAEKQGASRIELCASLDLDGLTPDVETVRAAFQSCSIPIRVIIRPREGGFVYSKSELEQMKQSILQCKEIGVEGVVFGVTTGDNELDILAIRELAKVAHPLKITIHKAIDTVKNPSADLKKLIEIKEINAVLTSGTKQTCIEGSTIIKELIENAKSKLEIIACGKVTDQNIEEVHQIIGAKAYHGKLVVGSLT
ncbi:MAG: copper homeostasis protein CutC [Cyclobacteriaceae bacterium]